MIQAEHLTKNFTRNQNEFEAVNDVTLHIGKGEFAALIGPSGSGKTTLFNMIAGIISPTAGQIKIKDTIISELTENQKADFRNTHMGYILQGQSLLGNFTILDNVCMPAYLSDNLTEFKEEALKLLEDIGLSHVANEYPNTLSGGEKRRVAIVRALLNHPDVILADEPTSNLDPENAHKVMQMLRDISNAGTTVLLSTHELGYLEYVDKVYEMKDGKLIQ